MAGLRLAAPPCDPCLYHIYRATGGDVGAITTQMDDTLECCESMSPALGLRFLERRFGDLSLQERSRIYSDAMAVKMAFFGTPQIEALLASEGRPQKKGGWR